VQGAGGGPRVCGCEIHGVQTLSGETSTDRTK